MDEHGFNPPPQHIPPAPFTLSGHLSVTTKPSLFARIQEPDSGGEGFISVPIGSALAKFRLQPSFPSSPTPEVRHRTFSTCPDADLSESSRTASKLSACGGSIFDVLDTPAKRPSEVSRLSPHVVMNSLPRKLTRTRSTSPEVRGCYSERRIWTYKTYDHTGDTAYPR